MKQFTLLIALFIGAVSFGQNLQSIEAPTRASDTNSGTPEATTRQYNAQAAGISAAVAGPVNTTYLSFDENSVECAGTIPVSGPVNVVRTNYNGEIFHNPGGNRSMPDLAYTSGPHFNVAGAPNLSIVENVTLLASTYGFGVQLSAGNSLAEDFVLADDYDLTSMVFYAYQTGETPPTITEIYMQIWDGDPSDGGSSIIFGDLVTNVIDNATFSDTYRVLEDDQGSTARGVNRIEVAMAGPSLAAGTYWVEYTLVGTGASGPWNPPVVILGETATGNALQNQSGLWVDVVDGGHGGAQGIPIEVYGDCTSCSGGATPCNQENPLSGVAGGGLGSSVDSAFKSAADITVPAGENFTIETIDTYFLTFAPNDPPTTAVIIYREDAGGLPGAQIGTETVVPTILNSQPWANPVADQYQTTMDVTPFTFMGDAGSDTKYWIEVSMGTATNQATVFWEYTNDVPVVGEPAAQYDDGAGTWSIPDPTQELVYDFIGSCEPMGGGGGPCAQENPLSGVAGGGLGSSVDSAFKTAADITVAAGENFTIENIDTYFLTFAPNDPPTTAVIIYREDAGGLPGAQIGTETVVPTILNAQPWANPVADQYETTMAVTPFTFDGDAGSDTKYWIEISMGTATNQATVFWEYTNDVPVVGEPAAQYDDGAGTWSIPDPTQEVVYNFSGTCESIGGGGPTCTSTTFDSADVPLELDPGGTSTADCANNPNTASVTIANGGGTIGSGAILENVVIDIEHTFSGDLDIWLRAPSGTELLLSSGNGGGTDDGYNGTTFEDGGADITAATAPFGVGPYQPQGGTFAAAFDGEDIDGDWLLVICDVFGGDTGFLNQFTLNMCLPPSPDVCEGAAAVSCGDVIVGTTTDNTDTAGNPAPDEWYSYTGSGDPEIVTVSLCDGGTNYDSYLRVFDACGGTEIAFNDDFCGLQSEVSFLSDGTSTYIIMIEGFAANAGDFSMAISCVPIAENDECENALPIACGDVISGSTSNSTFDNAPECVTTNTAPGVWYVYEDTSGLVTDILLSTCSENTDYDTKVSVYSGDCGELICVNGNDDSPNCSAFQTEVEFQSDGSSTYYILVHGFGSATGNFELSMSCVCVPMSNDDIANSNDADEVGFPYTDPGVQGPCATTEAATPAECDNAGVQGFWYNFTPEMDGVATCEVISPAGYTHVSFYDAPSESASEDELVLIDYWDNQCVPQNDASVPVVAGQAYYVYVANTGGITDVVIDGTFFLGANDNLIEGFTFAPNPAENVVNLTSVEVIEQVQLFNVLGQKVVDLQTNALTQAVDVSTLAVGTYIMQVTVNGQKGTYKVIKK